MRLVSRVYDRTAYTNPLHPDVFPGVNKMEAEIVRMVCRLFQGSDESCGVLTSGGTESIILAVKAWRDYGRAVRGIGRRGELVVPVTAHAAFQKACQLLDIRIRFVPIDPQSGQVDLNQMRRMCSRNTILLVGSACNYPHGIIDDIEGIAKVINKRLTSNNFPLIADRRRLRHPRPRGLVFGRLPRALHGGRRSPDPGGRLLGRGRALHLVRHP